MTELTDEQYEQMCTEANELVRERVAGFLAELDTQLQARFGGWELTRACWRENLEDDPAGQVVRAVVQAMGGAVC